MCVSAMLDSAPPDRVVFNKVVERIVNKVRGAKKTISVSVGVNEKMLKLDQSTITFVDISIRDHVTPDLVTDPHQE